MKIDQHPKLNRALTEYMTVEGHRRGEVEEHLWKTFGDTAAVLVTDMANFSEVTEKEGIVYYLTLIKTMQQQVDMLLPRHGGQLIKFLADNAFCLFPSVEGAVAFCMELNQRVHAHNVATSSRWDIEVCAGICFGTLLNINNTDLFGAPVNRAARLGEDLAGPREILLTQHAADQLQNTAVLDQAQRCEAPEEDMDIFWKLPV